MKSKFRKGWFGLILAAFLITKMIFLSACSSAEPLVTPDALQLETASTSLPVPPEPTSTIMVEDTSSEKEVLLIFDDDGSRDGVAALMYLLNHPDINIKVISISYGEAHPKVYVQHIGQLLANFDLQDIPLGAGQDAPLASGTPFPDWLRRMSDNFWDYPLGNSNKTYPSFDAPSLMVSTIKNSEEPIIIFVSGPFTNLAQALRLDPSIKENIKAVYFMGGAVYSPGNIINLIPDAKNQVAEWNIYADPLAAKEVFDSDLDLFMVPLDATNLVKLAEEEITPWHQGNEKAKLTAELYDIMFDDFGFDSVEIFDLTAAVIFHRPDLCNFQPLHLDVVIEDRNTLGQTIEITDREANISVCLAPNVNLVKDELSATFSNDEEALENISIDPIIGFWTGSVKNKDFEMQISITISETCQLGQICGNFNISNVACSGSLIWVGMEGDLFQFQASEKTPSCGEGIDYLLPQEDGSVMYISRGDYGETKGILQREP